jgi:hypothetical protein
MHVGWQGWALATEHNTLVAHPMLELLGHALPAELCTPPAERLLDGKAQTWLEHRVRLANPQSMSDKLLKSWSFLCM